MMQKLFGGARKRRNRVVVDPGNTVELRLALHELAYSNLSLPTRPTAFEAQNAGEDLPPAVGECLNYTNVMSQSGPCRIRACILAFACGASQVVPRSR